MGFHSSHTHWAPRLSWLELWPSTINPWISVLSGHTHHYFCFTLPLLPSTLLAPPLTVENILTAVQGVPWRYLGERLIYGVYSGTVLLGDYSKLDEIERCHKSEKSRLHAVIQCWLQGDGKDNEPSWRRIIWTLDHANETSTAADTIRHFAEPLPGESCDSITFLYSV